MGPRSTRSVPVLLTAVAVLAVLLPGCGKKKGRLPLFPVRGQVLVGGVPAKDALVYFWPEGIGSGVDAYCPHAEVDENGNFSLSTYEDGDGAPAGNYVVTVEWPGPLNVITNQREGDKLNGRFSDAKTSKLRAKVEERPNELEPFRLDK